MRRLVCLGGGPAGLFLARLVKLADPSWSVTVYERNAADATFGFGIGLGDRTLAELARLDPSTHALLVRDGVVGDGMEVRHRGETVRWGPRGGLAIARKALLRTLQHQAADAGVEFCFGREATLADAGDATVVVGADGVHSATRTALRDELGVHERTGAAVYIWLGAPIDLDGMTFSFVRTEHGPWAAHAYPYAPGLATFLVETTVDTWRRAGLDGPVPAPGTDERSRRYLTEAFSTDLGGAELLGNGSRWASFRNVRCTRWSCGNVVLIGDAAHTAHFSVGSGTTLAMEDSIALAGALAEHDVPTALASFEAARRPAVEHLQMRAEASQLWWETFDRRLEADAAGIAVHFLTRTDALTLDAVAEAAPALVARSATAFPGDPLDSPAEVAGTTVPGRRVGAPGAAGVGLVVLDPWEAVPDAGSHGPLVGVRLDVGDELSWKPGVSYVELCVSGTGDAANRLRAVLDVLASRSPGTERPLLLGVDLGSCLGRDVWGAPWGSQADMVIDGLARLSPAGVDVVRLRCTDATPGAQSLAVQLADRIQQETGLAVLLDGPFDEARLRTHVATGRVTLVEQRPADDSRSHPSEGSAPDIGPR